MKSTKWTRLFIAVLALAVLGLAIVPAAMAQVRDTRLSDSQEPGSFIVFPKFIKGTVTVDGVATPQTVIEISVVCPSGAVCTQGQAVRLHVEWVCPGNSKGICKETDFFLSTTVNGTVVFDPSKLGIVAPCATGYAVAWVVNAAGAAIKFDGLIGDAVLRNSGSSAGAYNGIPVQAHPDLANLALINTTGGLVFDGSAGRYQALTGTILSGVRFDKLTAPKVDTFLTLLTLDVISNRVNTTTFVDFLFWNASEVPTSTSTDFICFTEQQLSVDIDSNLTAESQGTAKGSFVGVASTQDFTPRTLLAIVETLEHNAGGAIDREYSYSVFNDSVVVPTVFRP